jgi:hypothetical protein
VARFATNDTFASYNGTAPIDVSAKPQFTGALDGTQPFRDDRETDLNGPGTRRYKRFADSP